MNIKPIEDMDTTTVLQLQYLIKHTFQSRLGLMCFYKDKVMVAESAEEMHHLLQAVWK